jgi:hypothetical protein
MSFLAVGRGPVLIWDRAASVLVEGLIIDDSSKPVLGITTAPKTNNIELLTCIEKNITPLARTNHKGHTRVSTASEYYHIL